MATSGMPTSGTAMGGGLAQRHGEGQPHASFHGRPVSWFAISVIIAGFLVGGAGLIFGSHGPTWWLFWTGAGLAVLGLLICMATRTFDDWY